MHKTLLSLRSLKRQIRIGIVVCCSLLCVAVAMLAPRMALTQGYHVFADQRTILGVPNFFDVISNIPFILVGALGVYWLITGASRRSFVLRIERVPYFAFFAGVALTGIGSYRYHLYPSNARLMFDLLPMTCCFMSMVAIVIIERISIEWGFALLAPLLVAGIASVIYWASTQAGGEGDYRFYLLVQFAPVVLLPIIAILFPSRYTGTEYLAVALGLFILAKCLEYFDRHIFGVFKVSGHTLKHVIGALACYEIILMLQKRRTVAVFEPGKDRPMAGRRRRLAQL